MSPYTVLVEQRQPKPWTRSEMMNMPVVTSRFWNIVYGAGKGEVKLDKEGMLSMCPIATNKA